MRVSCPTCNTAYNIDETKIPAGGAKLKCSKCQNTFPIGAAAGAPSAVPLPGNARAPQSAVPLPGNARAPQSAVPLPGTARAPQSAVPLPGTARAPQSAVPLPGTARAPQAAVPLPGTRATPSAGARPTMSAPAVPLPGSATGELDDLEADLGAGPPGAVPLPGGRGGVPSYGDSLEADFGEAPGAVPLPGAVAVGPSEDMGDFDSPAPSPTYARAPTPGEFDLPAQSQSGDSFELDFGQPAPSAPASAGDPFAAELDGPAPRAAQSSDDLEFDPTSPASARAQGGGGDDLEADLNAPISSPSAPAAPQGDDLELLDFIDDAAAQVKSKPKRGSATGSTRNLEGGFQIRKKSGQVIGPLPETEVTKQLSDGRLLGNEDISQDNGTTWSPLGSHPVFAEALQRLMEAPGGLPGAMTEGGPNTGSSTVDVNERMKQIYGGRMAPINIVDSAESVNKLRKNLPKFVAAGALALFVTIGLAQGLTPRGIFWWRIIHPVKIAPGDALYQKLVSGEGDLDDGSYGALKRAQGDADVVLKENDRFLQARALYVLATYGLQQRYKSATEPDLKRAHNYVEEMWSTNKGQPESVAAKTAEDLALTPPAESMRGPIQEALKKGGDWVPNLVMLSAQSYAASKTTDQAKAGFTQADGLGTTHRDALTTHARYLADTLKDYAGAAALLEKALAEKPDYGPAAVELATLDVGVLALPEKALEVLKPVGDGADLSDEEKARVHALTGMVLVFEKKPTDGEAEFKIATKLAPHSPAVEGAYAGYLLKRHDYEGALPLFQNAYDQQPDNLDALTGLAIAMVGKGNLSDLNKLVLAADTKFSNNPRVSLLKGMVAEGFDKFDDAEKSYKAAIAGDAKYTLADLYLARFYLRRRQFDDAKKVLDAALKKEPENPQLNATSGAVAVAEGRMDDAEAIFAKAIKLDADLADAHLGRAEVLFVKGQFPEAHTEAETAIRQDDKLPNASRTFGIILQAEKDYPKAKLAFQAANKLDPKDEEALLHLGEVDYLAGDYDGAQEALENARTLNHSDPEDHFYLALTHSKKTEKTQAIEEMNKAMEYGGRSKPEYHYNFGLIYKATEGRFQDATEEFKQALKLKPDYLDALEAYGDALFENNQFGDAVTNYEKVFSTDSKRTGMLGKVGDAYAKNNDPEKAIAAYQRHLQVDPTAVAEYFKIGRAYDDWGPKHKKEAMKAYREATKHDGENPDVWRALGYDLSDQRGEAHSAIEALEHYLKLRPQADDRKDIEDLMQNTKDNGGIK